tara:strand:+ start:612 stop:851 length:240 start_codon:yes stop_codon:yes gene_type:complete
MIDPNKQAEAFAKFINFVLKPSAKTAAGLQGVIKKKNRPKATRKITNQGGGVAVPRARRNQVSLMKPLDTNDEELVTKL